MKFLCDQCKAKYQIADEKVVGKTVKMKCRKCGHMIEVRAAVTETVENPLSTTQDVPTARGAPAPMATSLSKMAAVRPSRDALAGAFNKSMKDDEVPSSRSLGLSTADEWYVAINGVPVGPIRTSELRRKAGAGSITEDSLCWQEGFEEWRPVRSVPELAQMVRESLASGRISLSQAPVAPVAGGVGGAQDRRSSAPPPRAPSRPAIQRVSQSTANMAAVNAGNAGNASAAGIGPSAARSNVVPFAASSRGATAEKLQVDDDETVVGPNPSAHPQPVAPVAATPPTSFARPPTGNPFASGASGASGTLGTPGASAPVTPSVAPDPFAPPPAAAPAASAYAAAGPFSAAPITAPSAVAPMVPAMEVSPSPFAQPSQRKLGAGALAMIVMAGLFGITAALAIFLRPTTAPVATTVPTASAAAPSGTAATTASSQIAQGDIPPPDAVDDPNAAAAPGHSGARPTGGPGKTGTTPTASASGKTVDPSIAALLTGGPSSGPSNGSNSGGAGSGGSLTADQIEAVVRQRSPQVKRTCWEKVGSGKSNNTTVSVTIAGNGSVSSASANGNDAAMSKCIESTVKGWQFPATGGSTPVNIPFHFVAQ